GLALMQLDRIPEGIARLQQALERDARNADIRLNLGQAYARIGDIGAARTEFMETLQLAPQHADAMYNLGVLELERDALAEAERWFERALTAAPQHVDALVNLGIVARRRGEARAAIDRLEQALRIQPDSSAALDNLGQTLLTLGYHSSARERFLAALALAPHSLSATEGLVAACHALERYAEALPHLRGILQAEPGNEYAMQALAHGLFQCGELDEAQSVAMRAIALYPKASSAYGVLAQIHIVRGEIEAAVDLLEVGYEKTQAADLLGLYTHQLRKLCDWARWEKAWDKMHAALAESAQLGSPFNLLCETTTAREQLDYTRRWADARFAKIPAMPPAAPREREGRRLRVGYITSDFYEHPVGYLLAEAMELHDRSRFEIYAYSYGPDDGSATRARYCAAAEHFVDIARTPDDLACERIRADALDILIDLHGYTAGDRLAIMARRPCAIQATWLGYPCTTGARFIDYLIADPFVIPQGAEGDYASERVVRLPHCYQPNDRKRARMPVRSRAEYGLPDDAFVFCCFNQLFKITPEIYACWMQLLRELPHTVLWLMLDHPAAAANLRRDAEAQGVSADRVIFAPRIPLGEHLARYGVADLALDTFPYTSHTTASDALWGDCPLVGLSGDTFASRVSGSILMSAGLGHLLTRNLDDYHALARTLATTPERLREARAQVVKAKMSSVLFDTGRFARDLEALYEQLIER
ncbi:MAG TPA: tetratricopeptide repeat protein, partial [Burkholderiales bacterium]